jgi:thymidylate synthase (FAD)
MRFAYADFEIDGISRVCSHQIVRLAHAGLLQRSQRYVKETKVEYIDPPAVALLPVDVAYKWALIQDMAEELYLHLVDTKLMKKEDARYILPQGCATKLRMCLNFQAWQDFLNNRCHPAAQWEVRTVAMEIRNQLTQLAPELFGD